MQRRDHLDAGAMALMVVLCAAWGLQQVAIKVASVPPLLQAGIRSIVAVALLLAWARWKGLRLAERDGTLLPGLVAGVLFAGEFAFIYAGLQYTSASRGVIFLYTAPFVVALGAHWFLPGERLGRLQWAGLACAFAGLLAAFADSLRLPSGGEAFGDALVLAGALLWGATTLVIRTSTLARASATKTLAYQLGVSALLLPLASAALGEPGIGRPDALTLASLAYQSVLVAFASYLAWFWLVARYPAARLSAFSFLTPLFGVAFGGLLLGERVSPALALALGLVAAGLWLVNRPARRAPPPLTGSAGSRSRG